LKMFHPALKQIMFLLLVQEYYYIKINFLQNNGEVNVK